MSLKLFTNEKNPKSFKALIVAQYNGSKVEVPAFAYGTDNKTPEFLQKSPSGKVPVLETAHGSLSESNAIARYLAREGPSKLYGKNNFEAGLVDQWIDFAASEIDLPASAWLFPIQGLIPNNPAVTNKAQQDLKKVLTILDQYLLTRTYFVGNSVSLADIVIAVSLLQLYESVFDPTFRKDYVNVNRWFLTIVNQPQVKNVVGEVKLAEKQAVAQAAPKKEGKAEKPKKEEKPKTEKPKAEKPKEKPKKDEDDEEEDYEEKETSKNPLDLLPKSSFVMDEWKRMYSNNDTLKVAMPWFFEHFDKEGYSIWWSHYKYNNELEKTFMTSNLIGGFFQRLEKLHKYAFGSMIISGDEPKLEIDGVWVFRGPEVPAIMKECDDYEHYEWERLNLDDAAQKKKFSEYLAWEGELGGKKFNAGKVFK